MKTSLFQMNSLIKTQRGIGDKVDEFTNITWLKNLRDITELRKDNLLSKEEFVVHEIKK